MMSSEMAKLVLSHGEKNDATAFPFWTVAIKRGITNTNMGAVPISSGFWFSRKAAEKHLEQAAHHYPKSAFVFCFSGHMSHDVRELYRLAEARRCLGE